MSQAAVRVLLVEDNQIVRLAQELNLNQFSDLALCGYAADGLTAVAKAQEIRPQVVIMDIGLPGIDGIEATVLIKAAQPECKVVFVTTETNAPTIFAALAAGADAFCQKDISGPKLAEVIKLVINGTVWLDPRAAIAVLHYCAIDHGCPNENQSPFDFASDAKFAISAIEHDALYYQSGGASVANRRQLSEDEMLAHSQVLRRLLSRIVKRSGACDC